MNIKLQKYIMTRDRKLKSSGYYRDDQLQCTFNDLIKHKSILVGGRSSCGNSKNISWMIFTMWNEIVKKANSLGYPIKVKSIPQKNKSPTTCGGFWHENEYTLEGIPNE
jgi:hypothetical protein